MRLGSDQNSPVSSLNPKSYRGLYLRPTQTILKACKQSEKPHRDAFHILEEKLPGRQFLRVSAKVRLWFYLAIGTRFCGNRSY
jgi:hypothetical protein